MGDAEVGKYFAAIHRLEEKYGFNNLNVENTGLDIRNTAGEEPPISGEQLEALFEKMPKLVTNAYPSNFQPELEEMVDNIENYNISSKVRISVYPQKIVPEGHLKTAEIVLGKVANPVSELHLPGYTEGSLNVITFPERKFNLVELTEYGKEKVEDFLKNISDLDSLLGINMEVDTRIYGESDKGSGSIIYNIEGYGNLDGTNFSPKEITGHSHGADEGLWETLYYLGDMKEIKKRPLRRNSEDSYQSGRISFKDAVNLCELAMKGDKVKFDKYYTGIIL
ncbi:MAG: hypothetical protein KAT28_01310 [Candidatus Aenigmarchaeota archaeon]|nr:hypothetical protein [Candidatus Aenigmarchaeota archaeon]